MTLLTQLRRASLFTVVCLITAGCGSLGSNPPEADAPIALRTELDGSIRYDTTNQQVAELWTAADQARRTDNDDAALEYIYQALEISPKNSLLWSRAAEVQLDNRQALMAENLALKLIIEHARSLRGDLLGVRSARKRVQQYQYQ